MGFTGLAAVMTVLGAGSGVPEAGPSRVPNVQEVVPAATIWFDRGSDPVLEPGDRVRVFYRSPATAFVAIFQVDTDGIVQMVYPRSPSENHYARANREYRLLFPRSSFWNVSDRPGLGYFFIVTSAVPFDFSDFEYSYDAGGWDLSAVGNRVYEDPYVAMDDYVARLVPHWEYAPYGLDYVSYSVGEPHEYPRFLCYECHGFKPFNIWDPYQYTCTNFRVVVYDDPYFYPSRRYPGAPVVLVGRTVPPGPRFGWKERARGEPGTPVVRSAPAVPDRPDLDTSGRVRRAVPRVGGAPESVGPLDGLRGLAPGDDAVRTIPPATASPEVGRPGAGPRASQRARPSKEARTPPRPEAKRPVLERRTPRDVSPPRDVTPDPRSRSVPSTRRPAGRSSTPSPSTRSAPPRSRAPAVKGRSSPPASPPSSGSRKAVPRGRRPGA